MKRVLTLAVVLLGVVLVGCNDGPNQKSMVDSQKQIEEGNKKLGVEKTQE